MSALSELRDGSPPREAGSALRHAWALRQFAREVHSRKLSGLTIELLNMIDSMMRDHISGIRTGLTEGGMTPSNTARHKPELTDWNTAASLLFDVVSQLGNPSRSDHSAESTQSLISTAYDQIDEFSLRMAAEVDRNRKASAAR
jgi:hypothetical protein